MKKHAVGGKQILKFKVLLYLFKKKILMLCKIKCSEKALYKPK